MQSHFAENKVEFSLRGCDSTGVKWTEVFKAKQWEVELDYEKQANSCNWKLKTRNRGIPVFLLRNYKLSIHKRFH